MASVSLKNRADGSEWPIPWEGPGVPWPKIGGERWVPTREGAAIMCTRTGSMSGASQIITFDTAAEAEEAARTLYDRACGKNCERQHLLVWTVPGHLHVRSLNRPPLPTREEAIAACYPRSPETRPPATWPTPSILNLPLPPRGTPMTPERHAQDTAVEAAAGRTTAPEPGGLAGRAARAHDEAVAAFSAGDIDLAIGADMLAQALADASV